MQAESIHHDKASRDGKVFKRLALILFLILSILLLPSISLASDITHAIYTGTITVSNNTTTAINVFATCEISTSNLLAAGYFELPGDANGDGDITTADKTLIEQIILDLAAITPGADANQDGAVNSADVTAVEIMLADPTKDPSNLIASNIRNEAGTDVAYMPAISGNTTWSIHLPSVGSGSTSYNLYLGGHYQGVTTGMGSKIRYFPGTTGMSVSDNGNIEIGTAATWAVEIKGFVNTYDTGYLMQHGPSVSHAIKTNGNGTISLWVYSAERVISPVVSAAEHTIRFEYTAASANATLFIDGTQIGSATVSAPNYPEAWYFAESAAMPYMEYTKIWYDGVLKLHLAWQNSATFNDLSIGGNNATPTFRTSSSNSNVSATLASFTPKSPAQITSFTTGAAGTLTVFGPVSSMPTQMYTENDTSTFPGGTVIDALLDSSGTPRSLWWYPFLFIGIAIIGLLTYEATTLLVDRNLTNHRLRMQTGAKDGSLLAMCVVIEFCLVLIGLMGASPANSLIPFWPAILFLIPVLLTISQQWFVKS